MCVYLYVCMHIYLLFLLIVIKIHFLQVKPTYMKKKNKTMKHNNYIKIHTLLDKNKLQTEVNVL